MATPYASFDPALLALNMLKKTTPSVPNTPKVSVVAKSQPSRQPQAPTKNISTPKIGGISSPFGAPNINAEPKLGGATAPQLGKQQQIINSQPKAPEKIPATGTPDIKSRLSTMG